MFGLDLWEVLVIVVVALVVVGPRRLPEIAKTLGRTMRELRRASQDLRRNFDEALNERPPERTPNDGEPDELPPPGSYPPAKTPERKDG